MGKRQPNVLLIITDQQRADHLGCAGHPLLRTPHIDALAARGVRATQFHAASTTCMSNRATLMTGRMPSLHGVVHNGIDLSRDHATYVELMSSAGYSTALVGKSHLQSFGYDGPARRVWRNTNGGTPPPPELMDARKRRRQGEGYGCEWTPDWRSGMRSQVDLPYYGFDHVELATFHGDQVHGDYARWLAERHPAPDTLRGRDNALPDPRYSAPQAWRTRLPASLYPSAWVGERACEWLHGHAGQKAEQPFFLQVSFPDPHHPFTPPGEFWDLYRPEDVALPASFHAHGESQFVHDVHRYTREGGTREGYGAFGVSARECQEILALTFGMTSLVDAQVGRIMSTLGELGLERDTVVIFTSDHGDMMGDHGMVLKGAMHFGGLTRVPFVWVDPDSGVQAQTMPHPASSLDLPQTVLARCGLAPFNGMQGLNLLPWLRDPGQPAPARAGVMIESEPVVLPHGRLQPYRLRSLVNADWRVTVSNLSELCEMYDLVNDPLEQVNLWAREPALRQDRCSQLLTEEIQQADRSPLPTAIA